MGWRVFVVAERAMKSGNVHVVMRLPASFRISFMVGGRRMSESWQRGRLMTQVCTYMGIGFEKVLVKLDVILSKLELGVWGLAFG